MRAIKTHMPGSLLRKLPKSRAERKEIVRLGLQSFATRHRKRARSVVDDTFAALAIRKHAKIEQLIDQTRHGD